MSGGGRSTGVPAVKHSVTAKQGDPSLLDINNHLRPENTIVT